ncbi:MAG: FAD-binding protein, partial [Bacteroidales bacterium]|nr:FAD-binding protein [Bacteroidales bacterium]
MKRKLSLLLCLIMIVSMVAGCTQEDETQPPAPDNTDNTPKAMMAPGTYTAEAYGFSMSWPDILSVTVSENEIESISFDEESGSTASMVDTVAATMFPRVLESQSVDVDIVSGATLTSLSARTAIEDCIKQALVAAGNEESTIAEFKKTQEKVGGSEELNTQVLVIGMGGGGTYTALRAAEEGADVLVIEKQGRYGGTTALTSEIQSINPPRVQEKYNNGEDFTDADAMYQAWTEYTEGDAKKEMLDLYFENSGLAFDWLALDHGAMFDFDPKPGFTPADWYKVKFQWYPNTSPEHPGAPTHGYNKREIASYFERLVDDFTALGGKYMLETEAYELISDDTGAVVGAKAKNRLTGIEYTIKADAVVIAT